MAYICICTCVSSIICTALVHSFPTDRMLYPLSICQIEILAKNSNAEKKALPTSCLSVIYAQGREATKILGMASP